MKYKTKMTITIVITNVMIIEWLSSDSIRISLMIFNIIILCLLLLIGGHYICDSNNSWQSFHEVLVEHF